MRMRGFLGAVLLLVLPTLTFASGTLIYEQGSKASAQAGAFVARADDATAIFYNPAGLAFQQGMQFTFNLTYINTDVKYESPTLGSHTNNAKNFFIPAFYMSMPLNDRVTFGVGLTAPFNLATDWSDNFPGRYASRHSKIVTTDIRPVLAFKLDEHHAFAIGLDYYDSKVNLVRSVDTSALSTAINDQYPSPPFPPGIPIYQQSEGSIDTWVRDQALGWDISYKWNMAPYSLGLTYTSKATFQYEGHTSFEVSPYVAPIGFLFPGEKTNLELTSVPAVASFGFAYSGNPWTVEFDANWVQWSSWDQSRARFGNQTSFHGTPVVADETLLFDWKDTNTFRLGFGYKMSDNYELRFGILYDEAPVPDKTVAPTLPDSDRWSVTFGTGYHKGNFSLDWYGMYLKFKNRDIAPSNIYRYNETGLPDVIIPGVGRLYRTVYPMTADGGYKGTAYLFGMQMSYKF